MATLQRAWPATSFRPSRCPETTASRALAFADQMPRPGDDPGAGEWALLAFLSEQPRHGSGGGPKRQRRDPRRLLIPVCSPLRAAIDGSDWRRVA
jgi:hypothetical protein